MSLSIDAQIADMDFESLVSNWHKALLYPAGKDAESLISAIEDEWQYREVDIDLDTECPWELTVDAPNRGLLYALGYQVGVTQNQSVKLRQRILKRIYSAKLPIVHSSSYMVEWGQPMTRKRNTRIAITISNFIEQKSKYRVYDRAIKSWLKDLHIVEMNGSPPKPSYMFNYLRDAFGLL